jgi:hypothetical protein
MAEHRKMTKGEKWAVVGAAAAVATIAGIAIYEKRAHAATSNVTPVTPSPTPTPGGGGGGGGGGGTGDQNSGVGPGDGTGSQGQQTTGNDQGS